MQAGAAELLAPGRYRLTRLLRGQRGTEGAMGTPAPAGAWVVVLDDALASLPIAEADLGLPWNWRIGPANRPVSDETYVAQAFTPEGVGLRPFSIAHVEQPWRTPRTPGDLTIRSTRRSRALSADSWGAAEAALAEETEAYEVELLDGATVKRVLSTATTSALYTAAAADHRLGRAARPRRHARHPHLPALRPRRAGRAQDRHADTLKAIPCPTPRPISCCPTSWRRRPRSMSPTTRRCGCSTGSSSSRFSTAIWQHRPASPADGDRYIVASGATGDWAGWDLNVAIWTDGAWLRLPPRTGWRAWVEDEGLLLVYDGSGWIGTTPAALQNMALLGLGTTADASNPFSAKLNAALWTAKTVAEGGTGDLFYTMNKEATGDDLGLTLQTGFVTKALVGLFGSDRFRLAVSADGSTFFDGLSVDNASGIVDQPRLPRFKAYTNYDNYVGVGTWTKIGLNNTDYNDQGAFDAANNHFVAPVDGTYLFGATLLYKINASATARMRGRLVLNGTTEIRGSLGEISATHVSLATAIWLQTMVPLTAGDTVELQGYFRVADGYFAADHTSFWGCKIG